MQLHPGDSSWDLEEIDNILLNFTVIGMGIEWDNDRGAPNRFRNEVQIGDIVVIRHQGAPRYLVEVTGECKTNEGNNKLDVWFELFRKVKILSDKGEYYRDKYHTDTKQRWTDGLFAPTTFQTANNWNFAKYWYNDILNRINMKQQDTKENSEMQAEVVSVRTLIEEKNLRIPPYQRPYRWDEKNVIQLLNDIDTYRRRGKSIYRIGSIILHKNEDVYDIVDGQQRLTTICMILESLKPSIPDKSGDLCFKYEKESERVKKNSKTIQQWIEDNLSNSEKVSFNNYLIGDEENKKGCQFVRIIVNEISEAFQMFDTQNGRGKELEAYNLLKAYHIRAMEQDSESVKVNCDKRWENATSYKSKNLKGYNDKKEDILKYIFDETLYRSRKWSRRESAGRFSKKEIDEFKGFTIDKNHNVQFPFQNPQLLQYITSKFYESVLSGTIGTISRFKDGDPDNIDPFVNINQTLVNGKAFFDYVETYVEIYKRIFIELDSYQLRDFKEFYKRCCKDTHGRSGDLYLQNVYKSLIIIMFDRFGEVGVEKYYKSLFLIVYQYRISQKQVKYDGIAKNEKIAKMFAGISQATDMIALHEIQISADNIQIKQEYSNVEEAVVKEFGERIIK